jgi:hypothetical protein
VDNYGTDVANELDLLDFVDEEKKRAIQLRFFAEHVLPNMICDTSAAELNTEGEGGYDRLSEANLSFHNALESHYYEGHIVLVGCRRFTITATSFLLVVVGLLFCWFYRSIRRIPLRHAELYSTFHHTKSRNEIKGCCIA